ncbi:hypothetical protein [Yersinia enterocolitica]
MKRPISKVYSTVIFLVILLFFVLLTRYQQRIDNRIQQDNKQLKIQNDLLKNRILQLKNQVENLALVITKQAQSQTELEKKNDLFRQKTRAALAKTPCANQPVPVGVIRLQRELINPK